MKVPFISFEHLHKVINKECKNVLTDIFNSNWYILGEQVKSFEQKYAGYNNVNHCVGLASGLDALYLSLKALDIGIRAGNYTPVKL